MNARLIGIAVILFAFSATAHAQGKGHGGLQEQKAAEREMKEQAEKTYAQCVYNQGGYVAQVKWFAVGTMQATQSGSTFNIKATQPAFKTETVTLGQKSCVGGKGTKHWAVLTVKGGKYARAFAIAATDIGAVGGTIGCAVGAAALTVVTAGAGGVAAAGCEILGDMAIDVVADPSIIPDAKEMFAVVQPPASNGLHPTMIVMYGTVFNPATRTGTP